MKKIALLTSLLIGLASCSDDANHSEQPHGSEINLANIRLSDSQGNDLFQSPEYKPENIRIFYLKNGQSEEVYNGNLVYPRNFYVENGTMTLGLNNFITNYYSETLIKWNSQEVDTLRAHFNEVSGNYDKIWIDGEVVLDYSAPDPGNGLIHLVK